MPHTGRDHAVRPFDLAHIQPRGVVLLGQPFVGQEGGHVHHIALTNEGRQQTGLREVGDVGGVSGFHADAD